MKVENDIDDIIKEATGKQVSLDPVTDSFYSRIEHFPDQIIRYSRWNENQILWTSRSNILPKRKQFEPHSYFQCPHCKSERKYEFQIMPQILFYLQVEKYGYQNFQFDTILIYTCANSCSTENNCVEECAWIELSA